MRHIIVTLDLLTILGYQNRYLEFFFKSKPQFDNISIYYIFKIIFSGWDSNKGLGPPGKRGKLYPVKTTLKSDRYGLGLEEEEKLEKNERKVTHFEANDERGVTKIKVPGQRIERHTTLNKKYEKKKLDKQKQKEKNFRLEFSGL